MEGVCIKVKDLYKYFEDVKAVNGISFEVKIFMTTHYMDEAEKLCDQVLIIDQGKVITQGKPAKLIEKHFEKDRIELKNHIFNEEEWVL